MTSQRWLWSSVVVASMALTLSAQTTKPTFEVASVKRSAPDQKRSLSGYKGDTLSLTNMSLGNIIRFAYGIGPASEKVFATVDGEPRWSSDRFDIVAKTVGQVPPPSSRTLGPLNYMVQALLEERFKLTAHWETREGPIWLG